MMKANIKWLFALYILFLPLIALSAVPAWQIEPDQSTLTFTAIQNGAPVTGAFKIFSGDINFDPNQLSSSSVLITVDIGSISDPYNQLSDTLKTQDWFNTKMFPQAVFKATEFTKTGDNTFTAKGTLTIRDVTKPVVLTFTQEEYTPTKAKMVGTTKISRTAFGVGQGDWADTNTVKDDVKINFTIVAMKK